MRDNLSGFECAQSTEAATEFGGVELVFAEEAKKLTPRDERKIASTIPSKRFDENDMTRLRVN